MNTIHETNTFTSWLKKLRDRQGKIRIMARIRSATYGNFGDCKSVGDGVSEMRVNYGPGYRIYFAREEAHIYLLILAGDKDSQERDIRRAKAIWKEHIKGR